MTRGWRLTLLISLVVALLTAALLLPTFKKTTFFINRRTAKTHQTDCYFMALKWSSEPRGGTAIEGLGELTADDIDVPTEVWLFRYPWTQSMGETQMDTERRGSLVRSAYQCLFQVPQIHKSKISADAFDALMKRRLELWNRSGDLFPSHVIPQVTQENREIFSLPAPGIP